jgi:hypothetical protein
MLSVMADRDSEALSPVTVVRDNKVRAAGRRPGDVIVYDWGFEVSFPQDWSSISG